jgi:hypothetical protein
VLQLRQSDAEEWDLLRLHLLWEYHGM